jgi:CTP:phosphocholine cytidylyltransferase-like protein
MNKKYLILAGNRHFDDEDLYVKTYGKVTDFNYPNRWDNYLGVPKHLIPIKGEPLIHRTQRLLIENGAKDIFVTCNKENFSTYLIEGCTPLESISNKNLNYPDHEFFSTKDLINKDGITVILYGDIYFSESIIKDIVSKQEKDWYYYGRRISSQITGKIYGEHFSWYFHSDFIPELLDSAYKACEITEDLVKKYSTNPELIKYPWTMEESSKMTYRVMAKLDTLDPHEVEDTHWIEWDDETEDFDYPIDWDNWSRLLPHLAY